MTVPKSPGMSDWKGITPIHSYSFRMGLAPEKSYSRGGVWILKDCIYIQFQAPSFLFTFFQTRLDLTNYWRLAVLFLGFQVNLGFRTLIPQLKQKGSDRSVFPKLLKISSHQNSRRKPGAYEKPLVSLNSL